MTLWTLSEYWHCVESYDGRRIKKDLKYPCPSRSWWIVEATVWSVPVMKVFRLVVVARRRVILLVIEHTRVREAMNPNQ